MDEIIKNSIDLLIEADLGSIAQARVEAEIWGLQFRMKCAGILAAISLVLEGVGYRKYVHGTPEEAAGPWPPVGFLGGSILLVVAVIMFFEAYYTLVQYQIASEYFAIKFMVDLVIR